jgi:hypothetical protein
MKINDSDSITDSESTRSSLPDYIHNPRVVSEHVHLYSESESIIGGTTQNDEDNLVLTSSPSSQSQHKIISMLQALMIKNTKLLERRLDSIDSRFQQWDQRLEMLNTNLPKQSPFMNTRISDDVAFDVNVDADADADDRDVGEKEIVKDNILKLLMYTFQSTLDSNVKCLEYRLNQVDVRFDKMNRRLKTLEKQWKRQQTTTKARLDNMDAKFQTMKEESFKKRNATLDNVAMNIPACLEGVYKITTDGVKNATKWLTSHSHTNQVRLSQNCNVDLSLEWTVIPVVGVQYKWYLQNVNGCFLQEQSNGSIVALKETCKAAQWTIECRNVNNGSLSLRSFSGLYLSNKSGNSVSLMKKTGWDGWCLQSVK